MHQDFLPHLLQATLWIISFFFQSACPPPASHDEANYIKGMSINPHFGRILLVKKDARWYACTVEYVNVCSHLFFAHLHPDLEVNRHAPYLLGNLALLGHLADQGCQVFLIIVVNMHI
jgi:hypothetical protein